MSVVSADTPLLLTPGPLTTTLSVKEAMLRDWGSRDGRFIEMNRVLRDRLPDLVGAGETHVCVPVQGSGTFAVEATLGTLVPADGKLLVLVNGAYGTRMVRIARTIGRLVVDLTWPEDQPVDPVRVAEALAADADITHVAVVHCETTSGILNPIEAIAQAVEFAGRHLIIDAMSSFGAIGLDLADTPFAAVIASSNKCLQGAPGMGFTIVRRSLLAQCKGNSHSLALDLHDQWWGFESNGQWRFTPPTHVIAALDQALRELDAEGGVAGRGGRYRENHRILVDGMAEMGFETLLPRRLQAPIIVTFRMPADPAFVFQSFYDRLRDKGYVIYPGKLTVADSFRIGCIGEISPADMAAAVAAVAQTLDEMGVSSGAPQ